MYFIEFFVGFLKRELCEKTSEYETVKNELKIFVKIIQRNIYF